MRACVRACVCLWGERGGGGEGYQAEFFKIDASARTRTGKTPPPATHLKSVPTSPAPSRSWPTSAIAAADAAIGPARSLRFSDHNGVRIGRSIGVAGETHLLQRTEVTEVDPALADNFGPHRLAVGLTDDLGAERLAVGLGRLVAGREHPCQLVRFKAPGARRCQLPQICFQRARSSSRAP